MGGRVGERRRRYFGQRKKMDRHKHKHKHKHNERHGKRHKDKATGT